MLRACISDGLPTPLTNSVDPDEMTQFAVFYQGLHDSFRGFPGDKNISILDECLTIFNAIKNIREYVIGLHYSVDFIFLSFGIMGFIVEL